MNIIEFLKGKKTIITGLLMIALGICQGNQIMILEGMGLVFLRMGVANIGK